VDDLEDASGAPPPPPGHGDLADLLYTSGTTGLPKGASFRHRSLAHTAQRIAAALRLRADDVLQSPAPVYTSTGTHTFPLPVLSVGATYVVDPSFDVERTSATLEAEGTTVFFGVPAMLTLLLDRLPPDRRFPALRSLMYGGSPMPEPTVARLLERFPGVGLWNLYGLTETGPSGCVLPPEHAMERPGSVGLPVDGTDLLIVDGEGRELPPDEPGEIVMRGPTLMDGYHNLPEASREALVDGWMHTGDIGRKDLDGFVYLVDRKKDMIIRGGFNVYPAEIEKVLYEHPDVVEAAVVGYPHRVLGEDVCAVVALRPGAEATEDELARHCASRLADFKRPRRYRFVNALPRNSMGKVLRRDLRDELRHETEEVAG
jgi:long-chain acyl-CoA synthetase